MPQSHKKKTNRNGGNRRNGDANRAAAARTYTFAPRSTDAAAAAASISRDRWMRRSSRMVLLAIFAAVAMLAAGIIHVRQQQEKTVTLQVEKTTIGDGGTITLEGLYYRGNTASGAVFTIKADKASESTKSPNLVNMTAPHAEIENDSGAHIIITALRGTYERDTRIINLAGAVKIMREDLGYTITGESFSADLAKGVMTSDKKVSGKGPDGSFEADGMEIREGDLELTLTGNVKYRLE